MAHFNQDNKLFRCMVSHVIRNTSFESDNLGNGDDILTYDKKGAWGNEV